MENDVDGDVIVQKVGVENVYVLELEIMGNKLEFEKEVEVVFGMLCYLEISLEFFVVDFEMIDVGKVKVEGIFVEDGEFFMVNLVIIIEILVQEFDLEMIVNFGVVIFDDEVVDFGKEEMVMIVGVELELNVVDVLLEMFDFMGFKQ